MQSSPSQGNKKLLITSIVCSIAIVLVVLYLNGTFSNKKNTSDDTFLLDSISAPTTSGTELFGDSPEEKAVLDSLSAPNTESTVSDDVLKSLQAN